MISSRILAHIKHSCRCLHSIPKPKFNVKQMSSFKEVDDTEGKNETNSEELTTAEALRLGQMGSKYEVFREQDSEAIFDISEEKMLKYGNLLEDEGTHLWEEGRSKLNPLEGLNLQRGEHGVFDIEDLIDVLKRENAQELFVAKVPKAIQYVDYIVIVTGKSQKHLQAIAQFVRKVYKRKKGRSDVMPRLEGEDSKDWMALDLGNIALHMFSSQARELYDLDSLWAVGSQFDLESKKEDPVVEMLEKNSVYLKDIQPAS